MANASEFGLHQYLVDAIMPDILKRAGYHTAIVGKLHVRPESEFEFDERSRIDGRDVVGFADFAGEVMENAAAEDKPFFLMVNYGDPHPFRPVDPENQEPGPLIFLDRVNGIPETLIEPSELTLFPFQKVDSPEQRTRVAAYYNSVKRLDVGVGMLMDVLEAHGHVNDTLVILVGDHGPAFDRAKTTAYEAGLRVPFLLRWPGVTRPMRSDALVSTVDILPTVIDATGASPVVAMHGTSLRPVLSDPDAEWREYLVGEHHMHAVPFYPRRAIRDGRYKLIHNLLAGELEPSHSVAGDLAFELTREERYDGTDVRAAFDTWADPPEFEFYDLARDPWEFDNVAGRPEYREAQERLELALLDWRVATDDPFLDPAFLDELQAEVNQPES